MKILEYGYPHSNALLQFDLKLERCKPHRAARHPTKGDVIVDVKLFPTVYRRIYCRKYVMLSNQTSRYKHKCIRIGKWIFLSFIVGPVLFHFRIIECCCFVVVVVVVCFCCFMVKTLLTRSRLTKQIDKSPYIYICDPSRKKVRVGWTTSFRENTS